MSRPVLTFFSNKGGVGKTTLVYHVAWMLRELGRSVVVLDLDPQANLTASFLGDDRVEQLWSGPERRSVCGGLAPFFAEQGDTGEPHVEEIAFGLGLVPGDLLLSGAEQDLSLAWASSLDGQPRGLRATAAFATLAQRAATQADAEIVLVDVAPNLGSINRAAMIGSDYVVIPLVPDFSSLLVLQTLGPTLRRWRQEWVARVAHSPSADFELPSGQMRPRGYVILERSIRVDRSVGAYDRWLRQIPTEYRRAVLEEPPSDAPIAVSDDEHCLGLIRPYNSLAPLGHEARKPVFLLRSADGAIGARQRAVHDAYGHFEALTRRLLDVIDLEMAA